MACERANCNAATGLHRAGKFIQVMVATGKDVLRVGRKEAKEMLFKKFGFFFHHLQKTRLSPSLARQKGFFITFGGNSTSAELRIPLKVNGILFPFNEGKQATSLTKEHLKEAMVRNIYNRFDELRTLRAFHVTISWEREVIRSDDPTLAQAYEAKLAEQNRIRRTRSNVLFMPDTIEFSLHDVALKTVEEMVHSKVHTDDILLSSRNALFGLHVLALGLRGLIRTELGEGDMLTVAEKYACGALTYKSDMKEAGPKTSIHMSCRREDDSPNATGNGEPGRGLGNARRRRGTPPRPKRGRSAVRSGNSREETPAEEEYKMMMRVSFGNYLEIMRKRAENQRSSVPRSDAEGGNSSSGCRSRTQVSSVSEPLQFTIASHANVQHSISALAGVAYEDGE